MNKMLQDKVQFGTNRWLESKFLHEPAVAPFRVAAMRPAIEKRRQSERCVNIQMIEQIVEVTMTLGPS